MIAGALLTLFLFAAAGFGIYCYLNPEARMKSIHTVETTWVQVKSGVENSIGAARNESAARPAAEIPPPEPEL